MLTVLYCTLQVGSEEVDEQLQEEIEGECGKYGDVVNVIIYQVSTLTLGGTVDLL